MINEEDYNQVRNDIIVAITRLDYEDLDKMIAHKDLVSSIYRFIEELDIYEDNKRILNENAINGKVKIRNREMNVNGTK